MALQPASTYECIHHGRRSQGICKTCCAGCAHSWVHSGHRGHEPLHRTLVPAPRKSPQKGIAVQNVVALLEIRLAQCRRLRHCTRDISYIEIRGSKRAHELTSVQIETSTALLNPTHKVVDRTGPLTPDFGHATKSNKSSSATWTSPSSCPHALLSPTKCRDIGHRNRSSPTTSCCAAGTKTRRRNRAPMTNTNVF